MTTTTNLNLENFTVKAGEITYIGSLNLEMSPTTNDFGFDEFYKYRLEFLDKYTRDVSLVKKNYPYLKNKVIKKSIVSIASQPEPF